MKTTASIAKPKFKFPRELAVPVAQEIGRALKPACARICVAGSLRRGNKEVGDIELVYIPLFNTGNITGDFFATGVFNVADGVIACLEKNGVLERRKNKNGSEVFGEKNKLMQHCASRINVDLFATNETSWFNYLVCRTGPAESNIKIAAAAKRLRFQWNPYGSGFTAPEPLICPPMICERDVFSFVGLPWPNNRTEIPL